ncbi:uncharacterized protein SONE68_1638 [Lacticaseibacillus paracasei]|nr:uncharacterized protein SONE68_1638 [Lacticaseibacillus paracasei]GEK38466.1 hypothetical protein LCA02_01560 [Lacticaseibacillus casei]
MLQFYSWWVISGSPSWLRGDWAGTHWHDFKPAKPAVLKLGLGLGGENRST